MSMHIEAKPGEIAGRILLPGDPLRAKYIAEKFFDSPKLVNEVRGALCYTGKWNGEEVSVMGTGMGIPAVHIYATELCTEYGCEKLIRIGTAGGLKKGMKVNDIVLSQATSTTSSLNDHWFQGSYAPCADFFLLRKAYDKAVEMGIPVHVGNTICNDLLYRDERFFHPDLWAEYGIIASEMEGAALYTVAAHYQKQALMLMTIAGGLYVTEQVLTREEREQGLDNMILIGLKTLCEA
ncbi:MAG: purine-nucleoside phosphorylase [Oscillospiraceae bacterium]|nr:purine-nucleoside phosphorylase [Oscillospiraceae bacterium]